MEQQGGPPAPKRRKLDPRQTPHPSRDGLLVHPSKYHSLPFPQFSQPVELGCLSRDKHSNWHVDDDSQLKFFREPPPQCDLNIGFETFINKDDLQEKSEFINPILKWLLARIQDGTNQHSQRPSMKDAFHANNGIPHFVCWRGFLTKLLCTPFARDAWCLLACKHNGITYLAELDTAETQQRYNQPDMQRIWTYYGYKFEHYATRPRNNSSSEEQEKKEEEGPPSEQVVEKEEPVNNIPCYCTVLKARLNRHLILLSGEVDCCSDENGGSLPHSYIELKTNKVIATDKDKWTFERHKMLKFWAQSYLAGIPSIVVGFRDEKGIVRTTQTFKTMDIPRFVKGRRDMWDPSISMNFCDHFLSWVQRLMAEASDEVVYKFTFDEPYREVALQILSNEGEVSFLPSWFTKTQK